MPPASVHSKALSKSVSSEDHLFETISFMRSNGLRSALPALTRAYARAAASLYHTLMEWSALVQMTFSLKVQSNPPDPGTLLSTSSLYTDVTGSARQLFAVIAVERTYVLSANPKASASWGTFVLSLPEKMPCSAKARKDGTSLMTTVNADWTEVVKFCITELSSESMFPSCMNCESRVPFGQMAAATPGACCKPVSNVFPAAAAAAETPAPISGSPMNARPAVRAVRRSPRIKLVFCWGSSSVMRGWATSNEDSTEGVKAPYQLVKYLFIE